MKTVKHVDGGRRRDGRYKEERERQLSGEEKGSERERERR